MACRKRHGAKHRIFVVYLNAKKQVHATLRLVEDVDYQLPHRQHRLWPGSP